MPFFMKGIFGGVESLGKINTPTQNFQKFSKCFLCFIYDSAKLFEHDICHNLEVCGVISGRFNLLVKL